METTVVSPGVNTQCSRSSTSCANNGRDSHFLCRNASHALCGRGVGKNALQCMQIFFVFFFRDARFRLAFVKISQKNLNHSLQDMVCSEFCLEFSHPESCTVNRRAPHKLDFPLNCQFFEGYLRELTTSDSQFLHSTFLFLRETTFTWVDT